MRRSFLWKNNTFFGPNNKCDEALLITQNLKKFINEHIISKDISRASLRIIFFLFLNIVSTYTVC